MRQRAQALVEFALAWPIALLVVLAAVELAVWGAEAYVARAASLAGARAGSVAGGSAANASEVTLEALSASLVGTSAAAWCPGSPGLPPRVWVCALDLDTSVQVDVGGTVPALVPLVPGSGLPLSAHVVLQKEQFAR
jgi:hypothetical protein